MYASFNEIAIFTPTKFQHQKTSQKNKEKEKNIKEGKKKGKGNKNDYAFCNSALMVPKGDGFYEQQIFKTFAHFSPQKAFHR